VPTYTREDADSTLLRDVLVHVASCRYDNSGSTDGKNANPLIVAAENACQGHFRDSASLQLAKQVRHPKSLPYLN
jgi:hypothetical protein